MKIKPDSETSMTF